MANENDRYRPGYEWYPDQWKTSDTFYDVDDPLVRYFYREVLDVLYLNKNQFTANRSRFEKSMRYVMKDSQWQELRALFEVSQGEDGVEIWAHKSVLKRLDGRIFTSAENGTKGGRPAGSKNLKKTKPETNPEPKKPIDAIKDKDKDKVNLNVNEGLPVSNSGTSTPDGAGPLNGHDKKIPPLSQVGIKDGKPLANVWDKYGDRAERLQGDDKTEIGRLVEAFRFFWPYEISNRDWPTIREKLTRNGRDATRGVLWVLADCLQNLEVEMLKDAKKFVDDQIKTYRENNPGTDD